MSTERISPLVLGFMHFSGVQLGIVHIGWLRLQERD